MTGFSDEELEKIVDEVYSKLDFFVINGHPCIPRTFNEIYEKTGWGYDTCIQYIQACVEQGLLIKTWDANKNHYKYIQTQKFFTFKEIEPLTLPNKPSEK